jgi:hypothetical protein
MAIKREESEVTYADASASRVMNGLNQLFGLSIKRHPVRWFRAYRSLRRIYMEQNGGGADTLTSRLAALRKNLEDVRKLNIGCGSQFVRGWLNVGLFPEEEIEPGSVVEREGALVLHFNVLDGLPLPPGSIDFIYASHFCVSVIL